MGLYWLSGMDYHWIIANPIDWINFALCSWGFGVDQKQIGSGLGLAKPCLTNGSIVDEPIHAPVTRSSAQSCWISHRLAADQDWLSEGSANGSD